MKETKLRVCHQIGGCSSDFCVPVESPEEGYKVIQILVAYDMHEYENKIKQVYCNVTDLEYYDTEDSEWYEWHDEYGRDIDEYAREHGLNHKDIWNNCK